VLKQENQSAISPKDEPKQEPKATQVKPEQTPLFKAQTKTEISTQEMVSTRRNIIEAKRPKEGVQETLRTLLQGDKALKSEAGVGADFSVATARAILSTQTPNDSTQSRTLESLLQGHKEESSTPIKLDTANLSKSDSLDIKINEAKQMMRYLSADIKTAIEEYKSPFTRVKVQLNPQKLGEVDLTVVQRGKNLHVTLSSNNAAINTLAMNANDLKAQLTNSGIQNATLNFSNNPQSQDGSAAQQHNQQHQHQHKQRRADEEYNYFGSEEANEEILSSLEIVVPNYA